MYDKIKTILIDELGLDESAVTPEASLQDSLGITSLEFLDAVMVIEDEFNVSTDEERLHTLHTVNDLVQYVDELCRA